MDNLLVTEVTLQDYGVYRGKNTFDFTCTPEKPIILIGGTNGAGKTTLFESIMLCLYGISVMGKRSTKKAYDEFLSRKIHRYLKSATSADHASITVQFKFVHNGQETEYRVERSWRNEDGQIHENLDLEKRRNDSEKFKTLETMEKSHWQLFIEDIIPKGIVKLFFFDGEKIVKIANEETEDLTIKESFKSLLGIDVVEQLRTDLQVNLVRNLTKGGDSLKHDFEKYKADKDESLQTTERLQNKLGEKQTEMDSLHIDIENLESRISKIGGKFANNRDDVKMKLAAKELTYENIRQRIQDLCSGVLPFALIPKDLKELSKQIQIDESIQQEKAGQKLVESKLKKITDNVSKSKFWKDAGIDSKHASKISSHLISMIDEEMTSSKVRKKPMFGFSTAQASRILDVSKQANTAVLDTLNKDTQKIIEVGEDITRLQTSIVNAPNDDELGPLVSKVGNLHSDAGTLQAEMDHIEEKISSHVSLRQHHDSKLRDIVSQIYKNDKSKDQVELTQSVQKILDEFIRELTIKKIHLLEQYLLEAISILLHKKDFIETVKVNPQTFVISLFKKNNDPFPNTLLSEGEKQIFVTAILWALAKTSGRPLPFMIDTPLARLDMNHRGNIVQRFLPIASHQILIFSTDSEILYDDYKFLEPYLMRSYVMEYLEDEGITKKHNGYFWNKKGEKIVAI